MAFNPFDVFRRNQRVLFAVLTVFIMFMFTLSFGAGDFFTTFPKWLGAKRGYGEVMAVVDGSRVHRSQLGEIGLRRELANTYMYEAGIRASSNIAKYVVDGAAKLGEDPKRAVQEFLAARQAGYIDPRLAQQFQLAQQFPGFAAPSIEDVIGSRDAVIARSQALLSAIATDPKVPDDDKLVAREALMLMGLDLQLGSAGNSKLYFTNQPNKTARDELNFHLWLKKADDLGVVYTNDDVSLLISDEFRGKATAEDLQQALKVVQGTRAYADNPDNLLSALADEFRVRAAQSAVMGANLVRAPGAMAVGYDAPYDYFEYYKRLTSPARFGVVALPAEAFLPSVEGKPSESELRKLFDTARGVEADPARPGIGLRKPREIKVEFLEVKGDEPFYQQAAADLLPRMEAYTYLTAALTPATGTWPAALAAVAVGTIRDPLLAAEVDRETTRANEAVASEWYTKPGNKWEIPHPVDASVVRPEVAAAAVGSTAGGLLTGGAWPTAGLVAEAAVATLDWQGRATAMAALLSPPLSLADRLGAVADHLARTARPLPTEVVRPTLVEAAKKSWANRVAGADLQEFQKKLAELGAKADKSEVRAYVEQFAKDLDLKLGASTGLRDQYAIGDDPGLAPLKAKLAAPPGGTTPPFGRAFFFETARTQQGQFEQEARGLYQVRPFPEPTFDMRSVEPALVWRTEEKPAENPRDLNPAVRAQAEAGWRTIEARKKAKAAADALAGQCGDLGSDEATISKNFLDKVEQTRAKLATPEAKAAVKYFELHDVAPLLTSNLPLAGRSGATPYVFPTLAEVPYPTAKMTQELLAARAKGPSATAVLVDQPEDRYYVAVKYSQSDRTPIEFADVVYAPPIPGGGAAGAVARRHQEELKKQARETAVGLLKAEFRVEKESAELDRRSEAAGD